MGALLDVRGAETGYGALQVLHGLDFEVEAGQIGGVLGGNGSGKTTLLKLIGGLLPAWSGSIVFDGREVTRLRTAERVRSGMAMVVGRSLFADLTVAEHFELMEPVLADRAAATTRRDEVLELFPVLRDRLDQRAGTMSGGEQQQLAIARAVFPRPKLLLVDELSLGLQPSIVEQVYALLPQIAQAEGLTFLVVEQHPEAVLRICTHLHVLVRGTVAYSGPPDPFEDDPRKLVDFYLQTGAPA